MGPRRVEGPKISRFFSSPATIFILSSSLGARRKRRNRAITICSTSANFDFGQLAEVELAEVELAQVEHPPSISKDHEEMRRFSEHDNFSGLSHGTSRFKHGSVIVNNILAYFTSPLTTPQVLMIKERCWFSQINFFVSYIPHRTNVLFLSSQFLCHPHTQMRMTLFHGV